MPDAYVTMMSTFSLNEVGGSLREPFGVAAGESKLDLDRFAVNVAEIAKPRQEFALEARVGGGP